MQSISLAGVASYLPEKIVENDFFGEAITSNKNKMFSGVIKRRHVAEHETAVDMIENAAKKLIDTLNLNLSENKKNFICEIEDLKAAVWSIEKKEIHII